MYSIDCQNVISVWHVCLINVTSSVASNAVQRDQLFHMLAHMLTFGESARGGSWEKQCLNTSVMKGSRGNYK